MADDEEADINRECELNRAAIGEDPEPGSTCPGSTDDRSAEQVYGERIQVPTRARLHSIPLPIDAEAEMVEALQALQQITCVSRSFTEVSGDTVIVHFEAVGDAIAFVDTFTFLLAQMSEEDTLSRSQHLKCSQTRARLKTGISDDTVGAVRTYLSSFSTKPYTFERLDAGIAIRFEGPRDVRLLQEQFPGLIAEVTSHSDE